MFIYSLAEALHKTLDEIGGMTEAEFYGWYAYFKANRRLSGTRK